MLVSEKKIKVTKPDQVADIVRHIIKCQNSELQENFYAIGLNTKNVIQYIDLVSLGTANEALVHPRDVYRMAIIKNCVGIIICHNHPSNSKKPSSNDEHVTKRILESGKILGIPLIDHVIVTENECFSFAENNLIFGGN